MVIACARAAPAVGSAETLLELLERDLGLSISARLVALEALGTHGVQPSYAARAVTTLTSTMAGRCPLALSDAGARA
eukprot:12893623-Prorocentrum_lima.AAC.1